ncbi:MAG TPA: hypothetical protein PLX66_02525, partial [Bacilli bacterium]|nr:hypothetical protein [Bacilli bacterium]
MNKVIETVTSPKRLLILAIVATQLFCMLGCEKEDETVGTDIPVTTPTFSSEPTTEIKVME